MNNDTFDTVFGRIDNSKSVVDLKLDLVEMMKENDKFQSPDSKMENEVIDSMLFLIAELEGRARKGKNSLSKDQTGCFHRLVERLRSR